MNFDEVKMKIMKEYAKKNSMDLRPNPSNYIKEINQQINEASNTNEPIFDIKLK